MRFYCETTVKPHGIADDRLKAIELSLGTWMLRFAGLLPSPHAEPQRFRKFVDNYNLWRQNADFSSEDHKVFREQTKALREYVLHKADVVLSTLNLAGTHA